MAQVGYVRLQPLHFDRLKPAQAFETADVAQRPDVQRAVCAEPNVAFAMVQGTLVLAVGGVVQLWPSRGTAWLLPGAFMTRRHFALAASRCLAEMRRLQAAGMLRIECAVKSDVSARAGFVRRMQFKFEGKMERYAPDGSDYDMWAFVAPRADAGRLSPQEVIH